jgi:hypothetical protein
MFANHDAEGSMLLVIRFYEFDPHGDGMSESATMTSDCDDNTYSLHSFGVVYKEDKAGDKEVTLRSKGRPCARHAN